MPTMTNDVRNTASFGNVWRSCVAAIACGLGLFVAYVASVDRYFYGCFGGPFLMSELFGVPAPTAAAGILPVYRWEGGWDGQFHYHQSNDPFIHGDARKHIDNPSYRYQRNLIPALAYVTSRCAGFGITPPLWYQAIQLVLVAVGFGALVWLLEEHGISRLMALVWLFTGGLLLSLFRGLPDGPSDALFILSLCGLHRRNLVVYSGLTSLLVLCREGYAMYAAAVFVMTALGRIEWQGTHRWITRIAATAMPGIVVLGWAWYVAHQLEVPVLYGSSISRHVLVDWPFAAACRALVRAVSDGNVTEALNVLCTAGLIGSVLWFAVRSCRESALAAVAIPYTLLIAATGSVVWADPSGYFKASSALVVVGILLTRHPGTLLLRVMLAMMVVVGVPNTVNRLARKVVPLPPVASDPDEVAIPLLGVQRADTAPVIQNPAESVSLQVLPGSMLHRPLPRLFSKDLALVGASVRNEGTESWRAAVAGPDCIRLGYQLRDSSGRIRHEGRRDLRGDVPPGGNATFFVAIPLPRQADTYTVTVGMLQEGRHWFHDASKTAAAQMTLSVP